MGFLSPDFSNWATALIMAFVVSAAILVTFTGPLFTALLGLIIAGLALIAVYYLGVRVDNRLRHGKSRSREAGRPFKIIANEFRPERGLRSDSNEGGPARSVEVRNEGGRQGGDER